MVKSIAQGFDFSVGYRRQLLTFVYVKDLASAVFDALESGVRRKSYLLTDGKTYTQSEFRSIVKHLLGKRFVVPVKAPLWIVGIVCAIAERIAAAKGKASTLNRDKYKILRQRNWTCDITPSTTSATIRATTCVRVWKKPYAGIATTAGCRHSIDFAMEMLMQYMGTRLGRASSPPTTDAVRVIDPAGATQTPGLLQCQGGD